MRIIFSLLALLISLPVLSTQADELTPKEILERTDRARGNLEGIEWQIRMVSVEKKRTQKRTLTVKARDYNSLAEFSAPAKVKGQKILMIDRNMWYVKPGLRKPVPISPRQKLMGQAANGDIASTNYAGDYAIEKMETAVVDDEPCHLFHLVAASKKVTYDRIQYWVSQKRLVGVRADYFTVSGKKFKSARFEYNNDIRGGRNRQPFCFQDGHHQCRADGRCNHHGL